MGQFHGRIFYAAVGKKQHSEYHAVTNDMGRFFSSGAHDGDHDLDTNASLFGLEFPPSPAFTTIRRRLLIT